MKNMTQWQPIDTAPRDNNIDILVFEEERKITIENSDNCRFYEMNGFTHWMPLPPPPPKSTGEEKKILEGHINEQPETKGKEEYVWLVSYQYSDDKEYGFGNIETKSAHNILDNINEIRLVEKHIKMKNNYDSVIILNIIRLGQ